MPKQKKIVFWGIITIIVVVLVVLGLYFVFTARSHYYAIYFRTGDIYFGRLNKFSRYTLKDPYLLVFTQDQENPMLFQRFQNAFWAPSNKLKFNPENVIWMTRLAAGSPVITLIENPPTSQPISSQDNLSDFPATSSDDVNPEEGEE